MEKLSQNTANCCEMKHSNDTLYGENLYASSYKMNISKLSYQLQNEKFFSLD